jgi:hypothetical protein
MAIHACTVTNGAKAITLHTIEEWPMQNACGGFEKLHMEHIAKLNI